MPISYFYLNLQINIDISMCNIIFIHIRKIEKRKKIWIDDTSHCISYSLFIKKYRTLDKLFHKLTRSWRGYHLGVGSSKILFSKGIRTSPRKSLRPNMSECQTVSHNVLVSRPLRLIWNWNMVAYRPSSNSHAGNNGGASKNLFVLQIWKEMKRQSYLQCLVKFRIQRVLLHFRLSFPALWFVR